MKLYRLGEFGVRQNEGYMKKGEVVEGHKHEFNHVTAVWGRLLVEVLDGDGTVIASEEFNDKRPLALIKAGTIHRLTALDDATMYRCIYTSRDPDGTPSLSWSGEMSKDFF